MIESLTELLMAENDWQASKARKHVWKVIREAGSYVDCGMWPVAKNLIEEQFNSPYLYGELMEEGYI